MPTRQRYANAGYKERSRKERAAQRKLQPFSWSRLLSKHAAGMNVAREFGRRVIQYGEQLDAVDARSLANPLPLLMGTDEHLAFMRLLNNYSAPYPCYDAEEQVVYEWVDGQEVRKAAA